MREASSTLRQHAESLKTEGNALFQKAKYSAAIERYTEAITLCPDIAVLYVNRAMCFKKKQAMANVAEDAERALLLDRDNMKAHYLLGSAFCENKVYDKAIHHLTKALEAAREKGDSIKDEIWRQLAQAKYAHWEVEAASRSKRRQRLKRLLDDLDGNLGLHGKSAMPGQTLDSSADMDQASLVQELQEMLAVAAARDKPREVPSMFTCPLTMEVFREPVITPAGHSYERAALLEHLAKVGKFDPINRSVRVTEADIITNLGLRTAVQLYLDEHPYAWSECK